MVLCAFFLGSTAMFLRGVTGAFQPQAYLGFRGTGVLPAVSTLIAQIVALTMAFGFLLVHRERQELEIARLAMLAALTGAYNRRALFERGEAVFAHALRVVAADKFGIPLTYLVPAAYALDSAGAMESVRVPILQLHGDQDETIPYDVGVRLHRHIHSDKRWIRFPGQGHNIDGALFFPHIERFLAEMVP